jgi:uncharacterized membrane protein
MLMTLLKAADEGGSALAALAEPWSKLYAHSKAVSATVTFLHLVPLIVAAGTAWTADRATLRAARATSSERTRQLSELSLTHRLVVGGLALSFVSGVLLFLSDVDTFLPSPVFWVKLALVTALLANGFLMTRTERAMASRGDDDALWGRLRRLAIASAVLWISTTLAGVILATYA